MFWGTLFIFLRKFWNLMFFSKLFCRSMCVLPLLPSQWDILPSCSLFETFPRKLEVVLFPVYRILIWSKDLGYLHYQARVGDVIVVSRVSIHQCDPENAMRDPQRLYYAIHHRDPGNGGGNMGIQKRYFFRSPISSSSSSSSSSKCKLSSLESKLCQRDILVHIVLRLLHPRQFDLSIKKDSM